MSLTGKSSLSIKKKDVQEQKSIGLGFKNLVFAHKAAAGEAGINLNSLSAPSEMVGFVQPSVTDLLTAKIFFYRKNLKLVSSLRGLLMDYLSYDVATNSQINFTGFTAEEGEIFIGYLDYKPVSSQLIVDGKAISVTGELAVGVTDFSVGTPFEVAKYPSAQVGAVMVFRNGVLQARNSNNSSSNLDGNYYEIDSGDGLGSVIRFNSAPVGQSDGIVVVSNGLLIERPTGSIMAEVESLAGQIDAMIPALAAATGLAESAFQAAPNSVDLRTFGDQVIAHETRIAALESKQVEIGAVQTLNSTGLTNTSFSNPTNRITITFTAARTSKYKVYGSLPVQQTTGGGRIVGQIVATGGGTPNVLMRQMGITTITGSGTEDTMFMFIIVELQAGVSYTFDMQTAISTGTYSVVPGNIPSSGTSGAQIVAEEL